MSTTFRPLTIKLWQFFAAPRLVMAGLWIALIGALAACSPNDYGPVAGGASYGALSTSDMREYYFPRVAGYRYTFSNTLRTYTTGQTFTSTSGPTDTAYTLGYQGSSLGGDSVYAVIIKYQVPTSYQAGSGVDLYYAPPAYQFAGAFCSSSLSGSQSLDDDKAPLTSPEFSPLALSGRIRLLVDNFGSTTRSWLRDTIYFTSVHDSVALYRKSTSGYTKVRQLFTSDFSTNATWATVPNSSTAQCRVIAEDESLTLGGVTYAAPRIEERNSAYGVPGSSEISYAYQRGPVRHVCEWYVTTDGVTSTRYQLIREAGVIMYDPSEVID